MAGWWLMIITNGPQHCRVCGSGCARPPSHPHTHPVRKTQAQTGQEIYPQAPRRVKHSSESKDFPAEPTFVLWLIESLHTLPLTFLVTPATTA